MEVFGVKFAPLGVPMRRRLQTLAAGAWFHIFALGSFASMFLAVYLIFFTNLWVGTLCYLAWVYTIDCDQCERGGRPIRWVRNLGWWHYMRDYFPFELKKHEDFELDPHKNYLFCSFPHGMLATGAFLSFSTEAAGFKKLFPRHESHFLTLRQNLVKPYLRELLLSLGMASASKESIMWLLNQPFGGKVAALIVGGAAEALYSHPGRNEVVLNRRKGFVRLALQSGSPLVPVYTFGETELFDQVDNPEGSKLRAFQEWFKNIFNVSPVIPIGRGFLQYSFGWVPQRKPITTIVGKPLEVPRIENPTQQEIDAVHEQFVQRLVDLFEKEKFNYLENPEDTKLIIS